MARMRAPLTLVHLVGIAVVACSNVGCREDSLQGTGVELRLVAGSPDVRPEALQLLWLGEGGVLMEHRLGGLPATVRIETNGERVGQRKVVVRGLTGDLPTSEAARRVDVVTGSWVVQTLALTPGRLRDDDGDSVPNEIDDCPAQADPCAPAHDGGVDAAVAADANLGADSGATDASSDLSPADAAPPIDAAPQVGTGLRAEYFANNSLQDPPALTRIDPSLSIDWEGNAPAASVPKDHWSARWTGFLRPALSGEHTIYLKADDAARMWLDGRMIIDKWTAAAYDEGVFTLPLVAGQKYPIKVEFREDATKASVELTWTTPAHVQKRSIPQNALYPP
jgi:hypothetical protein